MNRRVLPVYLELFPINRFSNPMTYACISPACFEKSKKKPKDGFFSPLSEEQKKKYRYLDNKTGEKATWDLMKLEVELEGVDLEGFDFFGMAADLTTTPGPDRKISGSTEFDTEVFGDEEFKYQCPACGFRFN